MDTPQREDPVSEAIAGEFRAEMARKRISGTTLARVLGWPQVYLSRRLTGAVPLRVGEAVRIADCLQIPMDRLFAGVPANVRGASERLLHHFLALTWHNARAFTRLAGAAAVLAVLGCGFAGVAYASPAPGVVVTAAEPFRTCLDMVTLHAGIYMDHDDHFAGAPGPSCVTVTRGGTRITIDTNYQPGAGVVAYDAIQVGDYPWIRDPAAGLPAPVAQVRTVLHVSADGGPGCYLDDADIWFSRTGAAGPLRHIREMIIANRWAGCYAPYCAPHRVKIGRRHWYAGACMTGTPGHMHLLIRFLAVRQCASATFDLAEFLHVARHYRWLSDSLTVDSASYAPEVWEDARGLTYSMTASP